MTTLQLNTPLPSHDTMAALLALATGQEMRVNPNNGHMLVVLEPGKFCYIEGEHLDELFARQWVTADDDTKIVAVTPKGSYWLKRWISTQK